MNFSIPTFCFVVAEIYQEKKSMLHFQEGKGKTETKNIHRESRNAALPTRLGATSEPRGLDYPAAYRLSSTLRILLAVFNYKKKKDTNTTNK